MIKYLIVLVLAFSSVNTTIADALGTGFTYQGELQLSGMPANGEFDFEFELWDSESGGIQIGTSLPIENVLIVDGVFTTELDFGSGVFESEQLWLEMGVRDGASGGPYTTLSPRQKLTAAPFSLHAEMVSMDAITSVEIADNTITAADIAANAVGSSEIDSSQVQQRVGGTCEDNTYLVGINQDGSVQCAPLPFGRRYNIDDTSASTGWGSSIAIRNNGLPIIVHQSFTNGQFLLYACTNVACSAGNARVLDSDGINGRYNSIAIRQNGLPIISYYNGTDGQLLVYDCANEACSSGTSRTLDASGLVGKYNNVVIRDNGFPFIVYYDETNGNLKGYDCTNVGCSSGTPRTLDSPGWDVGQHASVAIRDNGLPIISYYDVLFHDLKIWRCDNVACSSGSLNILDVTGDVGQWSSIIILANGDPLISYYDATNGDLKIFDCDDSVCSSGTDRALDESGDVGQYTSMVIGALGYPLISYYDVSNKNLKLMDCHQSLDCFPFASPRTLDDSEEAGEFTSIAIRNNGWPIISYHEGAFGSLHIYSCGDPRCYN